MQNQKKTAILVVSFGTSHQDTCEKTIGAIEKAIRETYPQFPLFRAWTSKMILQKLQKEKGIQIPDVTQAMSQMASLGISDVIIQPTHVINGIENQLMQKEAMAWKEHFRSITFGTPLLTTTEDSLTVCHIIAEEFSHLSADHKKQALLLMGHGTDHFSNFAYAALDYMFKEQGYPWIFVGTVEAYPSLSCVQKQLKRFAPEEIILAPFMIVAGDHAKNDMAGANEDSWASQLKKQGYRIQTVLKGLGEYPQIRQLFLDHTAQAIEEADLLKHIK